MLAFFILLVFFLFCLFIWGNHLSVNETKRKKVKEFKELQENKSRDKKWN